MPNIWVPISDATSTGTTDTTWTTWATWASSNSTSTATTTWGMWNGWPTAGSSTSDIYYRHIWRNWNAPLVNVHTPPRSDEAITERMLAADRERVAAQRAARAEEDRLYNERRAEAERVARELLDSLLTPEQREMRDRLKRFRVVAQDGEVYEIEPHRQMHNVFRLRGEQRVEELCLYHPGVPLADNAIAQMLMLQTDVEQFRKTANKWDLLDNRKLIAGA